MEVVLHQLVHQIQQVVMEDQVQVVVILHQVDQEMFQLYLQHLVVLKVILVVVEQVDMEHREVVEHLKQVYLLNLQVQYQQVVLVVEVVQVDQIQ